MSSAIQRQLEIFTAASERPAGPEREAYLDEACASDDALRQRIESLLADRDEAGAFLASSAGPIGPTAIRSASTTEKPGDRIGRYKLLQQIGEGGCGVVYMAEQEEPVRRRVALKVIKLGMDTKSVIARFEAERQALALMDHSNIAKVLEAGATDAGRPYFVMELIRGTKITEYCDHHNLPTRDRLDLFIKVCQAIQHAHQKGIIHRDIKPSNILITLHDGISVPKVIDFGIAKATTDQRLTDKTLFTALAQFIGTPAYMSPEQAEMSGLDIDTRSDIYSLGVLLYELLTGRTPFDAKELMSSGLDAMRKTIREKEPVRPSTKLSQTLVAAEVTRRTGVATGESALSPLRLRKLVYQLQGDLDWIVMKCLEKDRARRYETANGLARDIERHLRHEPVVASPPGNFYRFQKVVRRNWVMVTAAAFLATVLVLGIAVSAWHAVRATRAEYEQSRLRQQAQTAQANEARERQQAQTEAAKSDQVAQFLKDMLKGVAPSVALGRDATMLREILDRTAERAGKDLKDQPAVEAELRSIIGKTYFELGAFAKAEAMQREALRIRKTLYGETNRFVAASLYELAITLGEFRDFLGAEALQRQGLAIRRQLFGQMHPDIADSLSGLASELTMLDKYPECETILREALSMQRILFGYEHPDSVDSLVGLALVLWLEGKVAEAETMQREALALVRNIAGKGTPALATSLRQLGLLLEKQGRLVEAELMTREALTMRSALLGEHPYVASALGGLGDILSKQGKLAEAEEYMRQGLAMSRKLPNYVNVRLDGLAGVLVKQGKLAEADALYDEHLQWLRQVNHHALPNELAARTGKLLADGRLGEAEKLARECLTLREQRIPDEWLTFNARSTLGGFLVRQKKYAEAEPMLLSGYRGLKDREDKIPDAARPCLKEALRRLVALYEATGNTERVTEWRFELTQWYRQQLARAREAVDRGNVRALNGLARLLATCEEAAVRDGPGAVAHIEKALEATGRKNSAFLDTLAAAHAEAGEFTKAVTVQKEAIALVEDETLRNDLAARLKLYESKTPYREP